ncbi:MAG: hypothetical protein QHI48_04510 [Bacteroidota bacterium]|nr:hypothetical protein [Bacteroidota bacterium]
MAAALPASRGGRPTPGCVCAAMLLAGVFLHLSCSENPVGAPRENIPPETYLSLRPDSALRPSTSRLHIHWWGDDPDGFVAGYFISFDGVTWNFTRSTDSVFACTFSGTDTTFTFSVRAVDDQGNHVYDCASPYGPEPFTDLNGNGKHDAGEPFVDLGLWDPTPAVLRFPVVNTPPMVRFVPGSDVPDTTFTVASFAWTGTDADGDGTIAEFRYALNDTLDPASWRSLPRSQTFITLTARDGIRPGDNAFYIKAVDIAGAESPIIRMPRNGRSWFVRVPRTDLLIVDDYGPVDETAVYYRSVLDTLLGGRYRDADVLDIKYGATSTTRGIFVPPYVNPTLIETFKLFRVVLWYGDNNPTLDLAQLSLPAYQQAGGRILFTASFPESVIDPRGGITDFAPVDSISPLLITFIPAGTLLEPDPSTPGYPVLARDTKGTPVAFVRALYRKINALDLYRLAPDPRWNGRPVVAVLSGDRRFALFSVPLHRFDRDGNVGTLFFELFTREFGLR